MRKFCPVCMVDRPARSFMCTKCSSPLVVRAVPSDATPGDRKAKYREARKAEGLTQVSAWVPDDCAADFAVLAECLRRNRRLTWGPLKDTKTGKLVSASSVLTGDKS